MCKISYFKNTNYKSGLYAEGNGPKNTQVRVEDERKS